VTGGCVGELSEWEMGLVWRVGDAACSDGKHKTAAGPSSSSSSSTTTTSTSSSSSIAKRPFDVVYSLDGLVNEGLDGR